MEVSLRYRNWGSFSIPLPETGTSFQAGTLNQYPLAGQWTCSLVSGREPAWIVRGTVHVDQRSSQPAPSDAKIGFALLGDRLNLLTAETAAVPFLLAGQSHDFENLYLVDGVTFPFLPAKNLTFTLMANAARIAAESF